MPSFDSSSFGDLGLGATGANVSELQAKLSRLGFPCPQTGVYDETTQNAVRNFQSRVGLGATGSLSGQTESLLNQALLRATGGTAQTTGDITPAPPACPRPLWQTGLMVTGGLAIAYGLWHLFNAEGGDEDEAGYMRALAPGREAKDITAQSKRISGADAKCARTPDGAEFLKAPRVEA